LFGLGLRPIPTAFEKTFATTLWLKRHEVAGQRKIPAGQLLA